MYNKNELPISDYEVLREAKIAYEYINNILKNSKIKLDDNIINSLENTMNGLSIIYSNAHLNLEHPDKEEQLLTDACCKNCDNKLYISENIDYSYQCLECDENFYDFETNNNKVWYENKEKENAKFLSSFNLNIEYDKNEKMVYIGSENSSGCNYPCHNLNDFYESVESYCNNYLKKEYSIEIWETEWHRDKGEGFIYDKTFSNYEEAIKEARRLFDKNDYASIEVLDTFNQAIYCCDNESEDFYFDEEIISCVDEEIINQYINNWNNKDENMKKDKLYCKGKEKYIAIDNTTDNCWVEEFNSEHDVFNWLLGKDLEKEDCENEI